MNEIVTESSHAQCKVQDTEECQDDRTECRQQGEIPTKSTTYQSVFVFSLAALWYTLGECTSELSLFSTPDE